MSFSFPRVDIAQPQIPHLVITATHSQWISRGILVVGCLLSAAGSILAYTSSTKEPSHTEERVIQACPPQEKQASPSGMLVYVSGAVKKPGVYTLYQDSNRVYDVITQAGGFSAQADKTYIAKTLNMVGKLKDGERVYIPIEQELQQNATLEQTQTNKQTSEQTTEQATTAVQLNPNTATQQQLEELRGIGAVRAQQVLQGRPYSDELDFRARSGLSSTVIDAIISQLIFSTD